MRRLKTFEGFHLDETTQVITHLCEEMGVNITSSEEIESAIIYTAEGSELSEPEIAKILEDHIPMLGEGKRIAMSIMHMLSGERLMPMSIFVYEGNLIDVIFSYLDSRLGDMEVESNRKRGEETIVYTKGGEWYFWHFKDDDELKISYQNENILNEIGLKGKLMMSRKDLDQFKSLFYYERVEKITANISTGSVKRMGVVHEWFSSSEKHLIFLVFHSNTMSISLSLMSV
jgi:hypothetical protein